MRNLNITVDDFKIIDKYYVKRFKDDNICDILKQLCYYELDISHPVHGHLCTINLNITFSSIFENNKIKYIIEHPEHEIYIDHENTLDDTWAIFISKNFSSIYDTNILFTLRVNSYHSNIKFKNKKLSGVGEFVIYNLDENKRPKYDIKKLINETHYCDQIKL